MKYIGKDSAVLKIFFAIIFVHAAISSFSQKGKQSNILIAFSKATTSENYKAYMKWISSADSTIKCVNLYGKKPLEAAEILEKCSGLVLTGGPDVNPEYYGKISDTSRCEMDKYRDSLEFSLIQKAMQMQIPILAICRGEQILNVYMGGSLIVDIPDDFDTSVKHRTDGGYNAIHPIKISEKSLLFAISEKNSDSVNTNHHQAVRQLATCFVATAFADDGIIEAYEWKFKIGKPFLLAVQWHPERKPESLMSKEIGNEFLRNVRIFAFQRTISK